MKQEKFCTSSEHTPQPGQKQHRLSSGPSSGHLIVQSSRSKGVPTTMEKAMQERIRQLMTGSSSFLAACTYMIGVDATERLARQAFRAELGLERPTIAILCFGLECADVTHTLAQLNRTHTVQCGAHQSHPSTRHITQSKRLRANNTASSVLPVIITTSNLRSAGALLGAFAQGVAFSFLANLSPLLLLLFIRRVLGE